MSTPRAIVTIFGITGDLSHKKLIPALYNLFCHGDMQNPSFIGFGRRTLSRAEFEALIQDSLADMKQPQTNQEAFLNAWHYVQGTFDSGDGFSRLQTYIAQLQQHAEELLLPIYYYAVAPEFFGPISQHLSEAGLSKPLNKSGPQPRIVIEKPFGRDAASARELNQQIESYFEPDQIYRIDHFLGKEAVQNILAFRFANGIFEPLWNAKHIDHVQITIAQTLGVANRAGYLDKAGALRDVIQNHGLELLAHVTMEQPETMDEEAVRNKRAAVLKQVRSHEFVTGQYEGYREEPGVDPNSTTDTFAAVTFTVDTPRWQGVPFYIRTGMKMAEKVTEISVQFKTPSQGLFTHDRPNILTFRIQPNAGIGLCVAVKRADQTDLASHTLTFCFPQPKEKLGDHEQLLLDCLEGNQTFFIRADEIEAAWQAVTSVLAAMPNQPPAPYAVGSWGPAQSDQLLAKDNRQWLVQDFSHCEIPRF